MMWVKSIELECIVEIRIIWILPEAILNRGQIQIRWSLKFFHFPIMSEVMTSIRTVYKNIRVHYVISPQSY